MGHAVNPSPILAISDLKVRYPGTAVDVLRGVELTVGKQELVAVIGASGSGKSTLIRCINRLVEPTSGTIRLLDAEVTALRGAALRRARKRMGMIFQEFNLIDRYKVLDNVLAGRLGHYSALRCFFSLYPRDAIDRAVRLLERVGLGDFLDTRADALSGGQRQRVGIARAIFQGPELLLVDEPTSSLDPRIASEIMGLIRDIAQEQGVAAVCNIHDVALARRFASRVVALKDGRKVYDGTFDRLDQERLAWIYAEPSRGHS
jgi:phosphonate transport system ATP-binding protein